MSTDGRAPDGRQDVVTVLIVDDHESFRSALRELVNATEGFRLVGEAPSGEAALEAVDRVTPRMVIVDKRMPGMGGLEVTRRIAARHPRIVTLLVSVESPDLKSTPPGGASAVVRKQELSTAVLREVWREHGQER